MGESQLKVTRRGEDGYKVITIRVEANTLKELDKLAFEANCSRNKLVNIMLDYGVHNITVTTEKGEIL